MDNIDGRYKKLMQEYLHKDIESELPIDSYNNEGSGVITITQALHGLVGGDIVNSNAGAVGGIQFKYKWNKSCNCFDDNTYQSTQQVVHLLHLVQLVVVHQQ